MPRVSVDAADPGAGLVLRPFRATRYGPVVGDDMGAVTSPPYDVIDEETVGRLYASHPYNVVRLILPRRFAQAPSYDGVSDLLDRWRREQVLVEDDAPALYVYEYTVGDLTVRGLVGALGLRDRSTGTVLPHEDVMPGPVEDRTELIISTRTNLEPILLVYDGDGPASDVADDATQHEPLLSSVASDGSTHTIWRVADPAALEQVARDLAPRRALIADGHHRYAAYQRAQTSQHGAAYGYGLSLLVDQQRYPLHLGAIHRVVRGLDLGAVAGRSPRDAEVEDHGADEASARRAAEEATLPGAAVLVCTDGSRWLTVWMPCAPSEIDTHALHDRLLPAWGVGEADVEYVHDAGHAVHEARKHAGVAVLVRAPSVASVLAAAEQGNNLPRKSTSFGPKPRMGLLMRKLETPGAPGASGHAEPL
jgi:uncharacterized protein (DUF1015 family)